MGHHLVEITNVLRVQWHRLFIVKTHAIARTVPQLYHMVYYIVACIPGRSHCIPPKLLATFMGLSENMILRIMILQSCLSIQLPCYRYQQFQTTKSLLLLRLIHESHKFTGYFQSYSTSEVLCLSICIHVSSISISI